MNEKSIFSDDKIKFCKHFSTSIFYIYILVSNIIFSSFSPSSSSSKNGLPVFSLVFHQNIPHHLDRLLVHNHIWDILYKKYPCIFYDWELADIYCGWKDIKYLSSHYLVPLTM